MPILPQFINSIFAPFLSGDKFTKDEVVEAAKYLQDIFQEDIERLSKKYMRSNLWEALYLHNNGVYEEIKDDLVTPVLEGTKNLDQLILPDPEHLPADCHKKIERERDDYIRGFTQSLAEKGYDPNQILKDITKKISPSQKILEDYFVKIAEVENALSLIFLDASKSLKTFDPNRKKPLAKNIAHRDIRNKISSEFNSLVMFDDKVHDVVTSENPKAVLAEMLDWYDIALAEGKPPGTVQFLGGAPTILAARAHFKTLLEKGTHQNGESYYDILSENSTPADQQRLQALINPTNETCLPSVTKPALAPIT